LTANIVIDSFRHDSFFRGDKDLHLLEVPVPVVDLPIASAPTNEDWSYERSLRVPKQRFRREA
jgi:hypothetical protein